MFMIHIIDGIGKNMLYVKYWFGLKFYGHIYFFARNKLSNEFIFSNFFAFFGKNYCLKKILMLINSNYSKYCNQQ